MHEFMTNYHLLWLLKASWQAAVLIVLVLAVQWAFGRRLSPRWRYGLWLLVAARLALPWTIPSPVSLFNFLRLPEAPVAVVGLETSPGSPSLGTGRSQSRRRNPGSAALVGPAAAARLRGSLPWLFLTLVGAGRLPWRFAW